MECDYAAFMVVAEQDRFNYPIYDEWRKVMGPEQIDGRKQWKLTALGEADMGRRKYKLEVWGDTASKVQSLNWHRWYRWLVRFDAKRDLSNGTAYGAMEVYHRLAALQPKHNLSSFISRPRSKSGGKSAGGTGWALGSHKSNQRISVYQSGKRQGVRLEIQASGNMLLRYAKMADEAVKHADGKYTQWEILESLLTTRIYATMGEYGFTMEDFLHTLIQKGE